MYSPEITTVSGAPQPNFRAHPRPLTNACGRRVQRGVGRLFALADSLDNSSEAFLQCPAVVENYESLRYLGEFPGAGRRPPDVAVRGGAFGGDRR